MTEQHPLKHSTDSLHRRRRKRALPAPEHPCGFSLCFALPSGHNKSTLWAFITQSLSCDSSPRDTGGEYGHSTSEESPTNDLLHLTFVFVVFLVLIVPGEPSPTTWTKSSSGSLRLASLSPTAGCRGASAAISPEGGPGATHAGKHPATTEQDGASLSAGRAHADGGSHGSRPDLAGRMHCAPQPNRWGSRSGRED